LGGNRRNSYGKFGARSASVGAARVAAAAPATVDPDAAADAGG
jgi:hypothetical protein